MAGNKYVVVLVCLQDANFNAELLELALHSLRQHASYKKNIVTFVGSGLREINRGSTVRMRYAPADGVPPVKSRIPEIKYRCIVS